MKLKDMQLPKPKKDKGKEVCRVDEGEKYPWGLRLSLDSASLKLLPEAKDWDVGEAVSLEARAKVISKRSNERSGGEADVSVELQITAMEFSDGKSFSKAFNEEAGKK